MVRDRFYNNRFEYIKLRLVDKCDTYGRVYNFPTTSKVAILIFVDVDTFVEKIYIVVETKTVRLQYINKLHRLYISLPYPSSRTYRDDGCSRGIDHKGVSLLDQQSKQG